MKKNALFNLKSSNLLLPVWLAVACFFLATGALSAQCDPQNDTIPPVAVCNEYTVVAIGIDDPNDCYLPDGAKKFAGVTWVKAVSFDDGSYDDCGNIHLTVKRVGPYSNGVQSLNPVNGHPLCDPAQDPYPDFPSEFERAISEYDSIKFYAFEAGTTQTIALTVYQLGADGKISLNQYGLPIKNVCLINVEVQDKIKPVCQAPANVTVTCETFDPSLWAYGNPTVTDNACIDTVKEFRNYTQFDTVCNKGTLLRTFQVVDCGGNSVNCTQRIEVNYVQYYAVRFPNDLIVNNWSPTGEYGQPTFYEDDCELIGVSYSDQVFTNVPNAELLLERTWVIINWCTYDPNLPVIDVPNPNPNPLPNHVSNLPGPTVSELGTPAPWSPTIVKIHPNDPSPTNYSTFFNANANGYKYVQTIKIVSTPLGIVTGKVYQDTSGNCVYDTLEPALGQWMVKTTGLVTGDVYETLTDATGSYVQLLTAADTVAEVTLSSPLNVAPNCASVYVVHPVSGQTVLQDLPVQLETSCPVLSVDLSTPFLRRCFENTYTVQACNLSETAVPNVLVKVTLDDYMAYTTSSLPGTAEGGNVYAFEVGTLHAGECKTFNVKFNLQCSAPFGATHCTEAHIYPDSLCGTSPQWSGADVEVSGYCDGDSVKLVVANIGAGNMTQAQDFVVVEDVIMYKNGTFQLNSGQNQVFSLPANGATWRLQAGEEPFHPWGGVEAAAVEGCGGLNTPGVVNLFPLNTPDPFQTVDCQQNIGSFDPNDKKATPAGYGPQHLIEANTELEYLIRFQNTGTDTAFTVVILDTLSHYLDITSVRPAVASHTYDYTVLDGNVLRFRFDNILLPDSNVNERASHGFIKFRVKQKPDNADGTRIENRAAIYFDFNDPVLTNTVFHTIGQHFILVSTDNPLDGAPLRVYPNPATDAAIFDLPALFPQGLFELSNQLGQTVRSERISGGAYRFERGKLPAGVYFFRFSSAGKVAYSGKVVLR